MIPSMIQYDGFNITFVVTEDCNLRCKYCYELEKTPKDLELDYAKKFIDIILTDPDPIGVSRTSEEWIIKQGLILDFIGGDALMRPHLVDEILKYFQFRAYELKHKWGNRWRASISTNGTLFDSYGVKEFLNKYRKNMSLGISVDGCPEIHNKNRSNSMDAILKNWDWYMEYMGEFASTKSTLNRDSIPYIYESIKFLHEDLRLKYINMNFIFENMYLTKADLYELDSQLERVVFYLLDHRDDIHLNMLDRDFGVGKPASAESLDRGWCGAGAMPTLFTNGKIYPCFRFTPNTMTNTLFDFHCGDVINGLDHKEKFREIKSFTRGKISNKNCLECTCESSCAWCVGGAFSETGKIYRQTYICEVKKIIDKHAHNYWEIFDKERGAA